MGRSSYYAALKNIRFDPSHGITIRSVFCHSKNHWITLAALSSNLKYDCEPLFFSADGKSRHVRVSIREPEIISKRERMGQHPTTVKKPHIPTGESNRLYNRVLPAEIYTRKSQFSRCRKKFSLKSRKKSHQPLIRLAWHITRSIEKLHNSKQWRVSFTATATAGWALAALQCGHDKIEIQNKYQQALDRRHADATDFALSHQMLHGEQPFNQSSTFKLATKKLNSNRDRQEAKNRHHHSATSNPKQIDVPHAPTASPSEKPITRQSKHKPKPPKTQQQSKTQPTLARRQQLALRLHLERLKSVRTSQINNITKKKQSNISIHAAREKLQKFREKIQQKQNPMP